ncbi:MAG TPA: FAD-dependent oxidoreductase, partial [Tepidisphaeraceae bacterium]|nr:FAD-dependent oxidoreductase [Tepidisphaeraceae bacterium]
MRLVIAGGVAAGMSAATRARRLNESAEIVVLEKGGFISFANCGMPYFIAGRIRSSDDLLVTTSEKVRARFNIDARTGHEVLSIDRARKTVQVRDLSQQREYELSYDKLILAPGGVPIVPPIPLIDSPNVLQLRTMEDTFRVDAFLRDRKPRHVTVIGAGF